VLVFFFEPTVSLLMALLATVSAVSLKSYSASFHVFIIISCLVLIRTWMHQLCVLSVSCIGSNSLQIRLKSYFNSMLIS
jgi:hypothetical protein